MKNNTVKFWGITALLFVLLGVYLFATAPAPLQTQEQTIYAMSAEDALDLLAHENNVTRTLFTKSIVQQGKAHGLKFSEDWRDRDVVAGPLPALFLRGISESIARNGVPLGLYLGSDFPIESSNRFEGKQKEEFAAMREDGKVRYFRDTESQAVLAMYPDYASAPACVSCHNDHASSSKTDWELGDIMGATTWSYPNDSLTMDEFVSVLSAYREGVSDVWLEYLSEFDDMTEAERPEFGALWPVESAQLPSISALHDSLNTLTSPLLMESLLSFSERADS